MGNLWVTTAPKRFHCRPLQRPDDRQCLGEIRPHSEPLDPGAYEPEGYVFVSSPGAVAPYHLDPEHNFLLQLRGRKTVHLLDGRDRSLVTERHLEALYGNSPSVGLVFDERHRAKDRAYELTPGRGLHFPVEAPHWVQNGPEVSVSISITFRHVIRPCSEIRRSKQGC